jgi:hypothetical protein
MELGRYKKGTDTKTVEMASCKICSLDLIRGLTSISCYKQRHEKVFICIFNVDYTQFQFNKFQILLVDGSIMIAKMSKYAMTIFSMDVFNGCFQYTFHWILSMNILGR